MILENIEIFLSSGCLPSLEGQRKEKEKARTWKKDEKKAKRAKKSFGKKRAMSDVIKRKPLTEICFVVKT